eukprot:428104-Rhodomonas_salina.1
MGGHGHNRHPGTRVGECPAARINVASMIRGGTTTTSSTTSMKLQKLKGELLVTPATRKSSNVSILRYRFKMKLLTSVAIPTEKP